MTTDLYAVLGVKRGVTATTIRAAYRRKAKKAHPDGDGGSAEAFLELTKAYHVLSDPERRTLYDETGEVDEQSALNSRAGALAVINAVLSDLLFHEEDFLDVNLVGVITDTLGHQIEGYQSRIASLTKAQDRASRMQGRFLPMEGPIGEDNLFDRMIAAHLEEIAKDLKGVRDVITRRKSAIELLKGFTFDPEQSPLQQIFTNYAIYGG